MPRTSDRDTVICKPLELRPDWAARGWKIDEDHGCLVFDGRAAIEAVRLRVDNTARVRARAEKPGRFISWFWRMCG